MNNLKFFLTAFFLIIIAMNPLHAQTYTFPDEAEMHEGTWL